MMLSISIRKVNTHLYLLYSFVYSLAQPDSESVSNLIGQVRVLGWVQDHGCQGNSAYELIFKIALSVLAAAYCSTRVLHLHAYGYLADYSSSDLVSPARPNQSQRESITHVPNAVQGSDQVQKLGARSIWMTENLLQFLPFYISNWWRILCSAVCTRH